MICLKSKLTETLSLVLDVPIYSPRGSGRPPLRSVYTKDTKSGVFIYYRNRPLVRVCPHEDGLGMSGFVRVSPELIKNLPVGVVAQHVKGREFRLTPLYWGNLEGFAIWVADRADEIVGSYTQTRPARGGITT